MWVKREDDGANRKEWLAQLVGDHGRFGDDSVEIALSDPPLAEAVAAALRVEGIDSTRAPRGVRVSGRTQLQRLLRLLPLPTGDRRTAR